LIIIYVDSTYYYFIDLNSYLLLMTCNGQAATQWPIFILMIRDEFTENSSNLGV
jgi:hypothetical protein